MVNCKRLSLKLSVVVFLGIVVVSSALLAQDANRPWMNPALSAAERADLVLKQLNLGEKLALLHGNGMANNPFWTMPLTGFTNGGAGYVEGVPRLGIPPLIISDAAYGVRDSGVNGRYATAMPSNVGAASGWDPESSCAYGEVIGRELRAQGFDMTLGGGINLTREPRNGRTFGLYEPAGGTAPDIAGKNLANPVAQVLAAALMLRYSFGLEEASKAIEAAVRQVIAAGCRTSDIFTPGIPLVHRVSTSEMGDALVEAIHDGAKGGPASAGAERRSGQESPLAEDPGRAHL